MNKFPMWVWASVAATVVLSLVNVLPRIRAEQSNRAVALAVEWSIVKEVAGIGGRPGDALDQLVKAGANALVVQEQTVAEAIGDGLLILQSPATGVSLVTGNSDEISRLRAALTSVGLDVSLQPEYGPIEIPAEPSVVRSLSLGIKTDEAAQANSRGLELYVRFGNRATQADWLFSQAALVGADGFLPLGDSVIGFAGDLEGTREKLKQHGLRYISPEFVTMTGDGGMRAEDPSNTLKLHTAQTIELSRVDRTSAVERFGKAFRERNVKILLVRPQNPASNVRSFAEFLQAITRDVRKDGGDVKVPRPYDPVTLSPFMALLLGMSMAPTLAFALASLRNGGNWNTFSWGISLLLGASCYVETGRLLAALAGSILFVVFAYQWLLKHPSLHPVYQYGGVSGLSWVGGLQVAGLLVDSTFMIQAGQFLGTKASVFAPILVVGLILLATWKPLVDIARSPILWGSAGASVLALGALAFMNARTGNDNPAAVSGLELQFRDVLDQLLPVRPRTKEFLIGHPALVVGLMLWSRSQKTRSLTGPALLILGVSVIGQTSVVNTMCHLHTPFGLSVLRVISGHVAGGIFGLVLWMALRAFLRSDSSGQEPA